MTKKEFRLENEYPYRRTGPERWIGSHLWRYAAFPLAALGAAIINNLCYSTIQILIGRAFDLITTPGWAPAALLRLALTVIAVAVGQGLSGLSRNYSVEFVAQRIERDARDELYVSLLGKSQTFHGRQRIGDIMARATNDVRSLNLMFSPGLMLIIDSAMAVMVPFLLIARMRLDLLLAPGILLILLTITVYDYNRRLQPVSTGLRDQFGAMNAGLAEAISGIEIVKANVQERYEWLKFTGDARVFRDYFVRQGVIQARYLPMLAFTLAWAGSFLHGLLLWRGGSLTLGEVIAYIGLVGTLRFPTFISIFSFNLVQMGIAGARRMLETINTETELDENEGGVAQPIRGEVVFEHVSFGYRGLDSQGLTSEVSEEVGSLSGLVLKDLSFTARPGETIAIVGQTGSGKTTLTRLINRIFDADSGRVLVDGVDVRDWRLESLRSQISTIEQDPFLFSRTLAENIAFGCADATLDEIQEAARSAQAHDFITDFRDGYGAEVGERGVTLSGGQRQRIAIARAFLTDPRILILDDSTSAIDSATEDQIQRAMRRISSQRTTFLITHRLSQIRWADRILVLRRGELVDQGTHEELLARCEDYRRIFARYD
ncbi:MAG: ABC transporter ATP-binding protein [Chloroflexi bacterium HGW-Chloroflexi-1]|nr:MAG: ABC transporter ATP-binding protein [Chloroflexi bacterium HGW-Chloroflexi-1]